MNHLFIAPLLALSVVTFVQCRNCYDNWSRCTPQTAFATGILWKSCTEYCRKCKGRMGGHCVKVHNRECSGGYQCQCTGGQHPVSRNRLDIATCRLGL
ncbi:hypothetical protein OESDEN_02259 [Oesophagostomum dentatum]|uniref:Uncharacterized protein n=1 Tax=Oesophagostomum dentatum TaxID=61180 RepID=A0A0B1TKJ8_OESDE|nr:hypothetical protein OESDEN_02259 [Oesophagostomum dentatum]